MKPTTRTAAAAATEAAIQIASMHISLHNAGKWRGDKSHMAAAKRH
jgi:hypothetical protein